MPRSQERALHADTVTLAAGEGEEFHAPTLAEFFPDAIFFEGTAFEMNRIVLVRLLSVLVLLVLFYLGLRKARRVPTRGQSVAELALDFVKVQIADSVLGQKLGAKYLPLLAAFFWGIFAMNITGIVPGLNIAGTSVFVVPLLFAIVAYVAFIYAGFKEVGAGRFFKNALFPSGVPWPVYIILTPVEIINIFIVRPLSLALRLTLNMMVGHLLLVLCFSATHFLFFSTDGFTSVLGVFTLAGGVVFTIFEFIVAILQAYVFTLLTAVYIQQSASDEH
jgi:F-type H+-transporting ATPase subunit a